MTVFWGLMIPLAGTTLGSACVFFLKDKLNELLQKGCWALHPASWLRRLSGRF